jgi:type II restriction enzyme
VINSSENPNAATNSPTRRYALNPECAEITRGFSTNGWEKNAAKFMKGKKTLSEHLSGKRVIKKIPIIINGKMIRFSTGIHNQIQKAVIEKFLPRYGNGAEVLYVGDTANKYLHLESEKLKKLNFFDVAHGKLPDVIAYSASKNWLYLIEAVHSANPINPLRHHELQRLTKKCKAGIVYITAFLDRKSSQKFIGEIAWETEVWIADNPDHLIHFNGGRFLGPYS